MFGIEATANANMLWTSKGAFEVTQECIATPLVPLYFAAVMTYCTQWRWRALAFAAAVPLFVGLGIARLLVMALPAALIGSPLFLIHAFYQLLLAALVVFAAAAWRRGAARGESPRSAVCVERLLASCSVPPTPRCRRCSRSRFLSTTRRVRWPRCRHFRSGCTSRSPIATMTVFDWRGFITGLGGLVAVQAAAFCALVAVSRYSDLTPQIRDVRAWAIAAPLAIVVIGLVLA